jgi:type IV pilus assembly protein PilC
MAHFTYSAEKHDGEKYQGVAEAADRFELYEIIRREGGKVTSVSEASGNGIWNMGHWNRMLTRVKEYEKILFARNLGAMLSAGLSLARALAVMERQTKNIKLKSAIAEIESSVRRGEPLHAALAQFPKLFPDLFIAMVRAGEEGGELPSALLVVADQTERIYDLKRKIRSAMIYPCIILIAIVGIGIVMMIEVVPTLAQTFAESGAVLPLSTRIVVGMSALLVHYTLPFIGGIVAFIVGMIIALRTKTGKHVLDFVLLKIPVIGTLVREINAARTARTLSSLISSGVDVISSLEISADVVQNFYFREVIHEAVKGVRAGESLSVAFTKREDLYPAFVGEMMSVGEETGATVDMLKRLAIYYEEQVDRKTKDMSTIIEPFLMLFIGAGVGFFAVSMITPIYQISQHIN